jgi:hypothetical protein
MTNLKSSLILTICTIFALLNTPAANAGVFNIPQFVEYQNWAVGIEPEITLSANGNTASTGIASNFKFTYGITPISNLQVAVGFGSGSRGFRTGATYTYDFIPDLEGQFGFGVALQGYYYKLKGSYGQTEFTLYPYMHNLIIGDSGIDFDPYVALPFGMALYDGNYRTIMQLVLGNYFKTSEHFGFTLELGINLKDSDTYMATGITYRD